MTKTLRTSLGPLIASVCLLTLQTAVATEWIELFNGRSLSGWNVRPAYTAKDHWRVEDGLLVAENPDKQGSVLWTDGQYRDYEVEVQYQTPSSDYDSGVFVRGEHHQVQIGISASLKIDLTGCIYAPKDGHGSYPARTDKVAEVHRVGDWNHLRIIVADDRIKTFLNGVPFVDYEAVTIREAGPIGLQLHAGHHMKLFFRSVLLRELTKAESGKEASTDFISLFDGQNIDSWVQRGGKARYRVENGAIVGVAVPETPNSFLCTPLDYADFELEYEVKVDPQLNSGVQVRSNCFDTEHVEQGVSVNGKAWRQTIPAGRVHGYQVEIDPSDRSYSGGIYDEGRRGWLNKLDGDENRPAREAFRRNEWNHFRVRVVGDRIQTWVNGVPAVDLHDGQTSAGFIGLQVHGIGGDAEKTGKQVRWRNLRIREL